MKTLTILLCFTASLSFAQSKPSTSKKSAKPDSVTATAPAKIQWDQQAGTFTYPANMSSEEKIKNLESACNGNYQAFVAELTKKQKYIDSQREINVQDMESARSIIQQLQAQLQQYQQQAAKK